MFVVGVEEFHFVADHRQGEGVGGVGGVFDDGPIGGPHEAAGTEGIVEAVDELLRVQPGIGLAGDRPGVGDLDEDVGVALQDDQLFQFGGLVSGAIGHVVDDHGELGQGIEKGGDLGHAGDGGEDGHGDLEIAAALPEGWHEGAAEPVAGGAGGGAEADAAETLFGEAGEMVGGGGVERIDAADAVKRARILLEDGGEEAVVVAVMDHLDDDGARYAIGLHEREERFGGGVAGGHVGAGRERELGIVLPDVDVGVEDGVGRTIGFCRLPSLSGGWQTTSCDGLPHETAAGQVTHRWAPGD